MAVPAWTGRRTWVGHHAWTPDYQRRREQADALFNGGLDPGQARSLVAAIGPAYLLADCRNRVDLSAELGSFRRAASAARPSTGRRYRARDSVPAMDFDLTDEQQLIRETAREFTDKEIVPRARENDRNHHFDIELVKKIAGQGYLGAIVPQRVRRRRPRLPHLRPDRRGGRPRLTRRCAPSSPCRPRSSARAILKWGTEEQKQHYLPKLCSGEWLGCFGLTEPDTGSDAANQKTRAKKTDSGWVINGSKMWISMGNFAKLRADVRPDRPRPRAQGHRVLPRRHRPARLPAAGDRAARWACTARTRRRSRSMTSRCPTTRCSARSATASRSP